MELKKEINDTIKRDLSKVRLRTRTKDKITALLFNNGFKRIYYYRKLQNRSALYPLHFLIERYLKNKYLVYISRNAKIGQGFHLPHCFSIIISDCTIGSDVTVMQQVTIGSSRGGNRGGCPTIGNNVFIGAGAKIIGKVNIGDNVIIGANAVVTKDIPSGSIVGGVPAKVIGDNAKEQVKYWNSSIEEYYKIIGK